MRTVFNMAISSDSPDIQRTARNALLQMLNTIVKNVTQFPVVSGFGICMCREIAPEFEHCIAGALIHSRGSSCLQATSCTHTQIVPLRRVWRSKLWML